LLDVIARVAERERNEPWPCFDSERESLLVQLAGVDVKLTANGLLVDSRVRISSARRSSKLRAVVASAAILPRPPALDAAAVNSAEVKDPYLLG
jgi:hypothetical protein